MIDLQNRPDPTPEGFTLNYLVQNWTDVHRYVLRGIFDINGQVTGKCTTQKISIERHKIVLIEKLLRMIETDTIQFPVVRHVKELKAKIDLVAREHCDVIHDQERKVLEAIRYERWDAAEKEMVLLTEMASMPIFVHQEFLQRCSKVPSFVCNKEIDFTDRGY